MISCKDCKCKETKKTQVEHPPHYNQGEIETIVLIEDMGILEEFCQGNIIKYISRYKYKGEGLADLKKAQWYLNKMVDYLERKK